MKYFYILVLTFFTCNVIAQTGHQNIMDLTGNHLNVLIQQIGSGNMFMDVTAIGNNHSISTLQKNEGNHNATITVINSGGAVQLNVLQQGSTNNLLNFYQSCANPIGCSATINQSSP